MLALAGNVDASSLEAVTDGGGTASSDAPIDSTVAPARGESSSTGSVDGLGLAWAGPPIADEKAATAMDFIADYLFRDDTGVVSRALDASKTDAYVSGQFITLHDPGVLVVTVGGDAAKAAKQRVLDELAKLEKPMDPAAFAAAREAFSITLHPIRRRPSSRRTISAGTPPRATPRTRRVTPTAITSRRLANSTPLYIADIVRRYLKNAVTVTLVVNSKIHILKLIAALLAALVAAPSAALAAGAAVPAPTMESGGGTTIVRQLDANASLVGVEVIVRAGLDRQTMKQNGLAAFTAQTILRTRVGTPPAPLQDAIAARGGSVRFTVDPGDVRFYVEALASDASTVLDLFRTALAAPDFSPVVVHDARVR